LYDFGLQIRIQIIDLIENYRTIGVLAHPSANATLVRMEDAMRRRERPAEDLAAAQRAANCLTASREAGSD
jgi:hypothetical protein